MGCKGLARLSAVLLSAACLLGVAPLAAPRLPGAKRVLVLYTDDHVRHYNLILDSALRSSLQEGAEDEIDLHTEFLDSSLLQGRSLGAYQYDFLRAKYRDQALDLVIATGTPAFEFTLQYHGDLFPHVPVVFCLVPEEEIVGRDLGPGVTGLVNSARETLIGTLDCALRLHPGTRNVFFISGTSPMEEAAKARAKIVFSAYGKRVSFTYLTGLPLADLSVEASRIPPDSVVLFHSLLQDREGFTHGSLEVMEALRTIVDVPIYGTYDLAVGHGMVGGFMPTFESTGRRAGSLAREVLALSPGAPLPPLQKEHPIPLFDWRELKRWGLREAQLPPGSQVLFKEKPFWRQKPWLTFGVLAFSIGETLLLVGVVVELVKRRRAEAKARESEARLSLAAASARIGFWEWRAETEKYWVSEEARTLYEFGDAPTIDYDLVGARVHPEDLHKMLEARALAIGEPGNHDVEYRVLLAGGGVRWLSVRATSFASPSGKVERLLGATQDITERKEAEEKLQASEERYRAFLTYSTEGVCRYETERPIPISLHEDEQIDLFFRYAYLAECNDVFAQTYGRASAEAMIGARIGDTLPRADPRNIEFLRNFIRSGYRLLDDVSYKTRQNGEPICIANSGVGIVEDGHLVRVWSIQRDITERLRADAALAESEARYRSLFEQSPIGIYRTTPDGRILAANPTLIRKLGYDSLEDLAARDLEAGGYEPAYPREEFKRRVERDGEVRGFEAAWITKDGKVLEVRESARAIRDSEGRILYYEGTAEDVTKQRRAERALGESETRYRDLFAAALDGMAVADAETGTLVECNDALQAMVGRTREELIGQPQAILHPPQRLINGVTASFALRRSQPVATPLENKVQHKDGSVRQVEIKAAPFDMGGRPHILGIFRDITERKRAEIALSESQAQLIALVESTNDLIWSVDAKAFGLLTFNNALRKYFLETRGLEIRKGMTPAEMLPPEYAVLWPEFYSRALREGPFSTLYQASSGAHTLSLSFNLVKAGTDVIGISVFGADITERRKAELEAQQLRQELAHVARVTTMGELAASIAHELNQPLGAILSNAEAAELFLQRTPPPLDEVREILADIRDNDQRASEVIRRMRGFLRRRDFENIPLDVNGLIRESARLLLGTALQRDVDLRLDLGEGLHPVLGDHVQFQQVLINLIMNAMDAVTETGAGERVVTVTTGNAEDEKVEICVADRGAGIPDDRLPHIFDPFYTTKGEGMGMGMGLPISRTIVESLRGRIWAENREGGGAAFYISLPVVEVA